MFDNVNVNKFDPWPLLKSIQDFFPVGLSTNNPSSEYTLKTYPGLIKWVTALETSLYNLDNYNNVWNKFLGELTNAIGLEVISTTYGQAPSYSCCLRLASEKTFDVKRDFELKVYVSIIGNYYTILGTEFIENDFEKIKSEFYHMVSPYGKFQNHFSMVKSVVSSSFPEYKFVPFFLYESKLPNTRLPFSNEAEVTIFNAIFGDGLCLRTNILGDKYYDSEKWIRQDFIDFDGIWSVHPLNEE